MTYDEPMYKMAVYAKVKGTEDKIANGLVKLKEEDESFTYGNDPETKELIIAGVGDMQLSVLMAKLQSKYKVEAVLKPAKIAYRETIKKKVEIHGRHEKRSRRPRPVRRRLYPLRAAVRVRRDDLRG